MAKKKPHTPDSYEALELRLQRLGAVLEGQLSGDDPNKAVALLIQLENLRLRALEAKAKKVPAVAGQTDTGRLIGVLESITGARKPVSDLDAICWGAAGSGDPVDAGNDVVAEKQKAKPQDSACDGLSG